MTSLEWTETTPRWRTSNPYRRHEAINRAGRICIERNANDKGGWFWEVRLGDFVCELPGGDLSDEDAKLLARTHLAHELRKLLEAVES